jgi:hypothetical protein
MLHLLTSRRHAGSDFELLDQDALAQGRALHGLLDLEQTMNANLVSSVAQ